MPRCKKCGIEIKYSGDMFCFDCRIKQELNEEARKEKRKIKLFVQQPYSSQK